MNHKHNVTHNKCIDHFSLYDVKLFRISSFGRVCIRFQLQIVCKQDQKCSTHVNRLKNLIWMNLSKKGNDKHPIRNRPKINRLKKNEKVFQFLFAMKIRGRFKRKPNLLPHFNPTLWLYLKPLYQRFDFIWWEFQKWQHEKKSMPYTFWTMFIKYFELY